jgi:hypothetical protein
LDATECTSISKTNALILSPSALHVQSPSVAVQFIVYRNESLCNNMQEAIKQVRFAIGIA